MSSSSSSKGKARPVVSGTISAARTSSEDGSGARLETSGVAASASAQSVSPGFSNAKSGVKLSPESGEDISLGDAAPGSAASALSWLSISISRVVRFSSIEVRSRSEVRPILERSSVDARSGSMSMSSAGSSGNSIPAPADSIGVSSASSPGSIDSSLVSTADSIGSSNRLPASIDGASSSIWVRSIITVA